MSMGAVQRALGGRRRPRSVAARDVVVHMIAMLRDLFTRAAVVAAAAPLAFTGPASGKDQPRLIGWVERVRVYPGGLEIAAKIDTGARSSSLNAAGMTRFTRDGQEWVRFEVTNRLGTIQRFEQRIVRIARIRRHRGQYQLRPVVHLGICLGGVYREAEVNLIDRQGFNYQMLVGRRFMARRFVVDPSRTFTVNPECKEPDKG